MLEYRGVKLTTYGGEDIPEEEAKAYIDRGLEKYGSKLIRINAVVRGEYVDLNHFIEEHTPFHRIRRITGYLVGTLDRFNDAKRSEESDRVKHSIGNE